MSSSNSSRLWKVAPSLDRMNAQSKNTLLEHLGIQFTAVGDDFIEATMPVDTRHHQPLGLLHGGASVVLAESLGSIASYMTGSGEPVVGLEINANHVKAVKDGAVVGRVTPLHVGGRIQVWDIRIRDKQSSDLVCVSRLTVMKILKKAL